MAIISSASTRVAYVPEVTPGTTPATPSFKPLRVTKAGDWTPGKSTSKSDELTGDRNVKDEMMLGLDPTGSYNFELAYGALDDILEGALFGTWASNVLKNGVARKTFTIEETLAPGTANLFRRYPMAMVNTLSLSITAREKITGSFGMMAQKIVPATAAIAGATYAAAGATRPMTGSGSVGALSIPGGTFKARSLNIEITNNLATRPIVGDLYSDEFREGDFEATGTVEVYLSSNAPLEAVIAHGGGALSVTLGSVANEKYTISLPDIVWLNAAERIGARTEDAMYPLPFRARLDETLGATIGITRAVA